MITRRNFIRNSTLAASTFGFGITALATALGTKSTPLQTNEFVVWSSGNKVFRKNLKNGIIQSVTTDLYAHSFMEVPNEPNQIITLEKWRSRLLKIDFSSDDKNKKIVAPFDRRFYGHATVLPDKKCFATIMVNHFTGKTYLCYYSIKDLQLIEEFEIGEGGAHEIGVLPDQKNLVIAMTGWTPIYDYSKPLDFKRIGNSKLVFFNLEKKEVIEEQILHDPRRSLAHLKVGNDGAIYALSDFMQSHLKNLGHGGVYYTLPSGQLSAFEIPLAVAKELRGEFLSLAINSQKQLLAVTNPNGGKILVFNLQTKTLQHTISSNSNGVSWSQDGERLFLSERIVDGPQPLASRAIFDPKLPFSVSFVSDPSRATSSHISNF